MCCGNGCASVVSEIVFGIKVAADNGGGVASNALFSAVVGVFTAVFRDGYGDGGVVDGYGQRAFRFVDGVVVGIGVVVQCVGECVRREADIGLAAGNVVGGTFIGCPAVAGNCHRVVGEGAAVVHPALGGGGQRDGASVDGQRAEYGIAEGVEAGDIVVAAHYAVAFDGVAGRTRSGLRAVQGYGQHIAFGQHILGVGVVADGERSAVIGLLSVQSGDGDRGGVLGYGQ